MELDVGLPHEGDLAVAAHLVEGEFTGRLVSLQQVGYVDRERSACAALFQAVTRLYAGATLIWP